MKHNKYLWITDPHLNNLLPWQKYSFNSIIKKEQPTGIYLTGDISNGIWIKYDLKMLAKIGVPVYFVLGNHEYFWSSIDAIHNKVRKVCDQYKNLIWLDDRDVVEINEETAVIGTRGWFDNDLGAPKWLRWKFEPWIIKDFVKLSFKDQQLKFKELAGDSCRQIEVKLNMALEKGYKTIYLLTHFPPWTEVSNSDGMMNWFWLAYNSNPKLGQTIEKIMVGRKQRVVCLSGHTHHPEYVRISRNIECQVGEANFIGVPHSQKIYI